MKTAAKKQGFFSRFIGDRQFYKMVLAVAVPIMLQNGITNFVGLLDNIMVGQIGTEQMSGAAIVNQLIFVYNLCIFGGVSGAGIFTAQYFGQNDTEGVRNTFRFKLWMAALLTVITIALFLTAGPALIQMYLKGEANSTDAAATLMYGRQYLMIMLIGLPAFMLGQVYASTLRECGETVLPMKAGIVSVLVNLVFNYLLIYGKFGFPKLGVQGAAIATVLSRYVEVLIIVIWSHRHKEKNAFAEGLYHTLKVPAFLVKKILAKGTPLLLNETLWAAGMAMLTQCCFVRGLNVAAALVMLIMAPVFPRFYNTNADAKLLAKQFIMVTAIFMPQNAFLHACYFTLRSGGKTIITFLFDSVFIWCVSVVIAYTLSHFTALPVIAIYTLVQVGDIVKSVVGFILVKKGIWLQNIVS